MHPSGNRPRSGSLFALLLLLILLRCPTGALHAQQREIREIRETVTNDFASSEKAGGRIGVKCLAPGVYRDSLIRRIDRIEAYLPEKSDTLANRYYRAIFGGDTLCFRERKAELTYAYGGSCILEVESRRAPHQRFSVAIDGLSDEEIAALREQMRQMKRADRLLNNVQTCIFYALNLLFDSAGIDPTPIITRNTTFTNGRQLNAFFGHLLTMRSAYPCRYKAMRDAALPGDCILVFKNAHNEYIHAAFYRQETREFHTKNGLFPPIVLNSIKTLTERYGRYDRRSEDLNETGLRQLADSILVFTID